MFGKTAEFAVPGASFSDQLEPLGVRAYRLDLRVLNTFRNDFDPEDKILGIRMRIVSY